MSDVARDFYVTMIRGKRTAFLLGPFATHAEALTLVDQARDEAIFLDPWAHFDLFGTSSLPRGDGNPVGTLNERSRFIVPARAASA